MTAHETNSTTVHSAIKANTLQVTHTTYITIAVNGTHSMQHIQCNTRSSQKEHTQGAHTRSTHKEHTQGAHKKHVEFSCVFLQACTNQSICTTSQYAKRSEIRKANKSLCKSLPNVHVHVKTVYQVNLCKP